MAAFCILQRTVFPQHYRFRLVRKVALRTHGVCSACTCVRGWQTAQAASAVCAGAPCGRADRAAMRLHANTQVSASVTVKPRDLPTRGLYSLWCAPAVRRCMCMCTRPQRECRMPPACSKVSLPAPAMLVPPPPAALLARACVPRRAWLYTAWAVTDEEVMRSSGLDAMVRDGCAVCMRGRQPRTACMHSAGRGSPVTPCVRASAPCR